MAPTDPEVNPWQAHWDRQFEEGLRWAHWAVRRWEAFPVAQRPRPLVLVANRTSVEGRFASGPAKLSFVRGDIEYAVDVPDGVRAALSPRRDAEPTGPAGETVVITDAVRGEADFRTDRGRRKLPAWRLAAVGVIGSIWVLDPEVQPPEWLPPDPPPIPRPELQRPPADPSAHAELSADGRTMVVDHLGSPPGVVRYPRATVIETDQAVAVVPAGEDLGPPGARTAVGYVHQITVTLEEPLGDRVFVNLHGHAGEVVGVRTPA